MSSTTVNLPSPRSFLAQLVSSLPSALPAAAEPANPLTGLPSAGKALFLTLHVLFPNELLPALDLLDRRLVTRFVISAPQTSASNVAEQPSIIKPDSTNTVYYVRSAQPQPWQRHRRSGSRTHGTGSGAAVATTPHYEVRLRAWNCSCPAFAFAAFPAISYSQRAEDDEDMVNELSNEHSDGPWSFGGASRDLGSIPVCKHLLACLLGERCEILTGFVEQREVGIEEAAGWAAGWAA